MMSSGSAAPGANGEPKKVIWFISSRPLELNRPTNGGMQLGTFIGKKPPIGRVFATNKSSLKNGNSGDYWQVRIPQ
jgi:hypothetical protein